MSVPYFKDFTKKTKTFFRQKISDEYNLGQTIQFKQKNDDFVLTAKLEQDANQNAGLRQKLKLEMKRDWGDLEIEDKLNKLSVQFDLFKFYQQLDLRLKQTSSDVECHLSYKPKGSFWNAKLKTFYTPNKKGNRFCWSELATAVGDDSLHLAVGASIKVEDNSAKSPEYNKNPLARISAYKLGFLYTPSKDAQYSVNYTPDSESNGLKYSFDLWRKMSANTEIAGRAEGIVDTKVSATRPVLSLGGGWDLNGNRLQGFISSNLEYGFFYRTKVGDKISATFGVSSYLDSNGDVNPPKLGYKVSL